MTDRHRFSERDARDTVIDLLGLGLTAPIQDVPVAETVISVPHNSPSQVVLECSQSSAHYRLVPANGDPLRAKRGTGEVLRLPTGPITQDVTFSIRAQKADRFEVPLLDTVRLHVGLDTSLAAFVKIDPADGVRALDSALAEPGLTDPRLVRYGGSVTVVVQKGQDGTDYTIEAEPATDRSPGRVLSVAPVRGLGEAASIEIPTVALAEEDLVFRVRATSRFGNADSRLLEARLPLKLSADPAKVIEIAGGPIADFGAVTELTIAESQATALYQVYACAVKDSQYRPEGVPDARVASVPVPNKPRVRVALPELAPEWQPPPRFEPVSEVVAGIGGALSIPMIAAQADRILIVRAMKDHEDGGRVIRTSVSVSGHAVQLIRPNPRPDISLAFDMETADLTVSGGEQGVLYHFRKQADPGNEFPLPAYIHKRDEVDASFNKGVGGLAIGVDFAIARNAGPTDSVPGDDPRIDPPAAPRIRTRGVAPEATLHVRAVKAQTGLDAALALTATIPAMPEVVATKTEVERGGTVRLVIQTSRAVDRYQLLQEGVPIRAHKNGNGNDLVFQTPGIDAPSLFVVRATLRTENGLPLARDRAVLIGVSNGT